MSADFSPKRFCRGCRKYDTCTEPCKPVEEFLKSAGTRPENDGDLPREFVESYIRTGEWPRPKTPKKRQILELYFLDGRKITEIALLVGCSKQYASKVVESAKEALF